MKSQYVQFNLGDRREDKLQDESTLPVTEKESLQEGEKSISPRMKYGHVNLSVIRTGTNRKI